MHFPTERTSWPLLEADENLTLEESFSSLSNNDLSVCDDNDDNNDLPVCDDSEDSEDNEDESSKASNVSPKSCLTPTSKIKKQSIGKSFGKFIKRAFKGQETPPFTKKVTFNDSVEIRTHNVILSNHPCCPQMALECDWPHNIAIVSLAHIEAKSKRKEQDLRLSFMARRARLSATMGLSNKELFQRQRALSSSSLKIPMVIQMCLPP
jgi:hypothetical protein